jgi:hypothetical protein
MRVSALVSLVLLLGVSASCSSSKNRAVSDPYATEESFCNEWAKAACNSKVVEACAGTADSCKAKQAGFCMGLVPPNYDKTNAKTCIARVKEAYSDAKLTATELEVVRDLGPPCDALAKGALAVGDACSASDQCNTVAGQFCVIKPGGIQGTCQVPATVGGGEACSAPEAVCDTGFYCSAANGNFCISRIADSNACSPDEPCKETSQCLGASGSMTCVAKGAANATCTDDSQCQSSICAVATGKCIDSVTLNPESASCKDLG